MSIYGLRPLDVGGGGDCFFKSVSHQLYGDSSHHLAIRAAGIQYLNDNPECFIESNTGSSWLEYLTNMSLSGTWADHIIIQAVANAMNLNLHIVELDDRFLPTTVVQSNSVGNRKTLFLGHISETHYVSTCPALFENASVTSLNGKTNRSEYMKTYRAKRASAEDKARCNEYNKKSTASRISAADKAKRDEYMKQYRANQAKRASAEDKARRNEYNKKSRAGGISAAGGAKRNEYMKQCRAKKKTSCKSDIAGKTSADKRTKAAQGKASHNEYMKQYRAKKKKSCKKVILKI